MLLSAKLLNNVSGVNSFTVSEQTHLTEGDTPIFYLRLVDKNSTLERYVPEDGATLSVIIKSVNDIKTYTKIATNPFPNDTSIWAFQMLSTEPLKGSVSLQLILTEGTVVTRGAVKDALLIHSFNSAYV